MRSIERADHNYLLSQQITCSMIPSEAKYRRIRPLVCESPQILVKSETFD